MRNLNIEVLKLGYRSTNNSKIENLLMDNLLLSIFSDYEKGYYDYCFYDVNNDDFYFTDVSVEKCMKILRNDNQFLSSFISANQNEIEKLFERMYDSFEIKKNNL